MRYELSDYEWTAIKPMLPNKPRGVRRVNDRRVLNGIFWVLRSGAPWRDLPETYGPRTTCYNRFVRWLSRSRPVKRMTIGCVRFFSAPCLQKRCCSRIVDTTQTGSGRLRASKARGPTSRLSAIAKTLSASVR